MVESLTVHIYLVSLKRNIILTELNDSNRVFFNRRVSLKPAIMYLSPPPSLRHDEFLVWTPSAYGGLTHISLSQNEIWSPALAINSLYDYSDFQVE